MRHALWIANRKDNPNRWGIHLIISHNKIKCEKENIIIGQYFNGENEDTYFSIGTNLGTHIMKR